MTKSPTAIKMLKFGFNLIDVFLVGQQVYAGEATRLAYGTEEAKEGRDAFLEKRPDFSRFPQVSVTIRLSACSSALALGLALCCPSLILQAQETDISAVRYMLEVVETEARQPGVGALRDARVAARQRQGQRGVWHGHPSPRTAGTKGVFNSPYNGSWSSSGMNPKFFEADA